MENPCDFESHLDYYVVRKLNNKPQATYSDNENDDNIHHEIPLLITDLLLTIAQNDKVSMLRSPFPLRFRSCIIYGFISAQLNKTNNVHKYLIDDGTGNIEVSIFSKPKEMRTVGAMYSEEELLCNRGCNSVSESILRLLGRTMESTKGALIPTGSNVLLLGSPHMFKGKLSLHAISFSVDNCKSRSLEIAFATNLINWYKKQKESIVSH